MSNQYVTDFKFNLDKKLTSLQYGCWEYMHLYFSSIVDMQTWKEKLDDNQILSMQPVSRDYKLKYQLQNISHLYEIPYSM